MPRLDTVGVHGPGRRGQPSFRGYIGCSIHDCSGKHYSLGFCRKHYNRERFNGSPNVVMCEDNSGSCTSPGCTKKATCKRLCVNHYHQMLYRTDKKFRFRAISHRRIHNQIRAGHISPKPCEVCGASKADAHHSSYLPQDALKVMWLCQVHHLEWHSQFSPIYP